MSTRYYIHTQNKEFVEKYFFNEYRLVDEPCFGYEICIGHRSGGWKPLFNQHNDAYTSVEEMKEFLSTNSDKISIYDESERFLTLNELEDELIKWAECQEVKYMKYNAQESDLDDIRFDISTKDDYDIKAPFDHIEYDKVIDKLTPELKTYRGHYTHDKDNYDFVSGWWSKPRPRGLLRRLFNELESSNE